MFGLRRAKVFGLLSVVQLVSKISTYVVLIHQRLRQTDGRHRLESQYRALHNSASRGKNHLRESRMFAV